MTALTPSSTRTPASVSPCMSAWPTPESANRLARRKRWPRVKGDDGRVRVTVPEEVLIRRDNPPVVSSDNPVHAQSARLEGELVGTREALAEARARAAAAGHCHV